LCWEDQLESEKDDLAWPQNSAKGCNSWTRDIDNNDTPVFTDGSPDWTGFTTHHATNSTPLGYSHLDIGSSSDVIYANH
ncbi:Hypothetical predicted protein, partial [Mytilus galloprovincialis]